MTSADVQKELRSKANKKQAENLQRFFKTKDGEYGAGDIFAGLKVPQVRLIAKKYKKLSLKEIEKLLHSKIHEERQCALFILNQQFAAGDEVLRRAIFKLYLYNARFVNNWDLVDGSAPYIAGPFLFSQPLKVARQTLVCLAKSTNLWERRISILATFYFIKNKRFAESLRLAELLINDKYDLMHKAVGWMLREIGNRDRLVEEGFLKKHFRKMPRTMLRYAIEKFSEPLRKKYLNAS
jgi:3-methyladenine DNA glycosylase AlkD